MKHTFNNGEIPKDFDKRMTLKQIAVWNPFILKEGPIEYNKKLLNRFYYGSELEFEIAPDISGIVDAHLSDIIIEGNCCLSGEELFSPRNYLGPRLFINPMQIDLLDRIDKNIETFLKIMHEAPSHHFLFLTQNPVKVNEVNFFYDNVTLGAPLSSKDDLEYLISLKEAKVRGKFLLAKPIVEDLGELDLSEISWVIIGADDDGWESLKKEHVENLVRQCKGQNVPIYLQKWHEDDGDFLDGKTYKEFPEYLKNNSIGKRVSILIED